MKPQKDLSASIRSHIGRLISLGIAIVTLWSMVNHYYGSYQGGLTWIKASRSAVEELLKQEMFRLQFVVAEHSKGHEVALASTETVIHFKMRNIKGITQPHLESVYTVNPEFTDAYKELIVKEVKDWISSLRAESSASDHLRARSYIRVLNQLYIVATHHGVDRTSIILRSFDSEYLHFLERITATELILTNPEGQEVATTLSCEGPCSPTASDHDLRNSRRIQDGKLVTFELAHPYEGAYGQYHVGDQSLSAFTAAVSLGVTPEQSLGTLWILFPEDVMLFWPKVGILGILILSILLVSMLLKRLTQFTRKRLAPIAMMIEEVGRLNQSLMSPALSTIPTPEVSDEVDKLRVMLSLLSAQIDTNNQLSDQLRQSQKMEVIGTLAGGVAHDFNNLMSVILFNSECLREDFMSLYAESNEPLPHHETDELSDHDSTDATWSDPIKVPRSNKDEWIELVDEMLTACEQAKILTQQLLSLSRDQRSHSKAFSAPDCLADVQRLFQRLISEDVRIDISTENVDLWVTGNENAFQQALMNIVLNARDSLEQAGHLTLKIQAHTQSDFEALTAGHLTQGDYVLLSIQDNGSGIPEEDIERLFIPFFSSKGAKGTGLGLTIVYNVIVDKMGGAIRVTSQEGEGSCFELFVPRIYPEHTSSSLPRETPSVHASAEHIIIIEDHDIVRKTLAKALRVVGFKVTAFGSGVEFIQWFERNAHLVDVVVSDVVMPDLSGPEVWATIIKSHPDLPFIFLTGYAGESISHYAIPAEMILSKPISIERLKERIIEVTMNS